MQSSNQWKILKFLVGALILKVNANIVLNYRDYFPPNFDSEFLNRREEYFYGPYQWAFWLHIAAGPLSLILGLLLINDRFRARLPGWHRILGRVQVINVLCLLVPSGLWMAKYAAAGPIAGLGLATLGVLTGLTVAMGWRTALQRRFLEHRRWMLRNFTLLCSAVVLRLMAGTATTFDYGPTWFDPLISWACWVLPLLLLELSFTAFNRRR